MITMEKTDIMPLVVSEHVNTLE